MNPSNATGPGNPPSAMGDGLSMLLGSLAGLVGGVLLGGLIAWTVSPTWSLTSAIIVFHVTLAMVAMGAWTAPSLISDPKQDAQPSALGAPDVQPASHELKSSMDRHHATAG